MNPFMLLIGPVMAVGMFIIKMFVAAGYAISGAWAVVPKDGGKPGVAVYAHSEEKADGDRLVVRLPSGEVFVGIVPGSVLDPSDAAALAAYQAANPATSDPSAKPAPSPPAIVELSSDLGRIMRCRLDAADGTTTIGSCRTATGESFELVI